MRYSFENQITQDFGRKHNVTRQLRHLGIRSMKVEPTPMVKPQAGRRKAVNPACGVSDHRRDENICDLLRKDSATAQPVNEIMFRADNRGVPILARRGFGPASPMLMQPGEIARKACIEKSAATFALDEKGPESKPLPTVEFCHPIDLCGRHTGFPNRKGRDSIGAHLEAGCEQDSELRVPATINVDSGAVNMSDSAAQKKSNADWRSVGEPIRPTGQLARSQRFTPATSRDSASLISV